MIPIMPDGEVKILDAVPFDREHVHTCLFASKSAQTSYMLGKVTSTLSGVSYQRVTKNTIRVQLRIQAVYNSNYIMFKNSAFEDKWFYAFIINAEYVNNITTEITYEIDNIQTWMFDYTLGECFVEREHSVTDVAGDNIVPEQVNLGDYVLDKITKLPYLYDSDGKKDVHYVIWSTMANPSEPAPIKDRWGLRMACAPYESSETLFQALQDAGKADAVIAYTAIPTHFITQNQNDGTYCPRAGFTVPKSEYCFQSFDGYTPKNRKLYTYPYNFLQMSGFNGVDAEFAFEYFRNVNDVSLDNCPFIMICEISPNTKIAIAPGEYKGANLDSGAAYNYEEMIQIYTYPQMPFSVDPYKNQLGANLITGTMGMLKSGIAGGLSGGIPGAALGVGMGALDLATTLAVSSRQPVVQKGQWDDTFLYANNLVGGWYARKHIKRQFAQIIDNYFTMFGYATKQVKVPNVNSRPHWNYVKTLYCFINGNLPEGAESDIRDCFNKGITFWKNPSEIGNYSLDNSPT